jgi:hypothetical protein
MANNKVARRTFLRNSLAATVAVPFAGIPVTLIAQEKLSEDDPQAMALGYKHDASTVDAAKFPQRADGQVCKTCQLYQGGDAEWGGCGIFPGKQVNGNGWCSAWVQKAG